MGSSQELQSASNSAQEDSVADSSHNMHPTAAQAVDFLSTVQQLKLNKRMGWKRHGIMQPESIADHMYRMALFSLTASTTNLDTSKLMRMAVVHDIAEAIVGDITPHDGVSAEEKYNREAAAIQELQAKLGAATLPAKELAALWHEYEAAQTPEAQLVKDFDKLEMIMQAAEYEQQQGVPLEEFFQSTQGKFRTEWGQQLAAEIVKRRKQISGSQG